MLKEHKVYIEGMLMLLLKIMKTSCLVSFIGFLMTIWVRIVEKCAFVQKAYILTCLC